jgi:gliding motility-associated-like protein
VSLPQKVNCYTGETKCGASTGYIKAVTLPEDLDAWYVVTPNNDTLDQPIGNTFPNLGAGNYSVYYIDSLGCKSEDTIVTIETYNNTIADFSIIPSSGASPLVVQIDNQSQNATDYSWWLNGEYQGNSFTGFYTDTSGVYDIELIAWKNDSICADTVSYTVIVFDSLIVGLPNVFTPNNDGVNDYFNVKVNLPVRYKLNILNRWGNVVFENEGELVEGTHKLWNGTAKNGSSVTDGTYFYTISFVLDGESVDCDITDCEVRKEGFVQVFGK